MLSCMVLPPPGGFFVLVKWHKNVKNTSNLRENYVKTSLKSLIFNHFLRANKVAKNEKFRENYVRIKVFCICCAEIWHPLAVILHHPNSTDHYKTQKTMNTTKEIRKLRKEVRALQDEVRAMRYERLDQLIADMKTAARDMLEASRGL